MHPAFGEGSHGVVAKVNQFAVHHPQVVRRINVGGVTVTVVDLTAAQAGDGLLAFWPVSHASWAVLSGTQPVPLRQLMRVQAGIHITD